MTRKKEEICGFTANCKCICNLFIYVKDICNMLCVQNHCKKFFMLCIQCTDVNNITAGRLQTCTLLTFITNISQLLTVPECSINTTDSFYDVLLWASFSTALRGIQCQLREVEGCAHMLLGNNSFCVPTQPADTQRDTIAALQATIRPHIQALGCLPRQLLALPHWLRIGWASQRMNVYM